MTRDAIVLTDVEKRFVLRSEGGSDDREFIAVTDVDVEIEAGQFLSLVGTSGCGKTTLLNMVAGLVTPSSGTVTVFGGPPRLPNTELAYMFARDALLPWRTAQANVEFPLEARGWSRSSRGARAREMLELVGLAGRERQYPLEMSQGMRQRVAIARTLAPDPRILLMDEPFAAVDARTRLSLQREFLSILEADAAENHTKRTVLFVTHDLEEAALLADRVITMLPNPGRVAMDLEVNLPRPRAHQLNEILFTDEFAAIKAKLFYALEGAIAGEGSAA